MNTRLSKLTSVLLIAALLISPLVAAAQGRKDDRNSNSFGSRTLAWGALPLQINGTVVGASNTPAGAFSGIVTINRFARVNNQIVAVGIVRGTIVGLNNQPLSSGMQTVMLPVRLSNRSAANFSAPSASPKFQLARFTLAQAQSCGILHLDIGGNAIDLLGFNVNLSPITLDVSGDSAGPLGALVCQILALLGTVADVVGLLNGLLGLLTGLLGGLTGGLGGQVG